MLYVVKLHCNKVKNYFLNLIKVTQLKESQKSIMAGPDS